jgi:hypothetical protein
MIRKRRTRLPSLRNGLKWRDGRPRWEPSPALREVGIKGVNLVDEAGEWMDRGAAIGAADARMLWARLVRQAELAGPIGDEANIALARALEALPPAKDAADRNRRRVLGDLVELAALRLGQPRPMLTPKRAGQRSVGAMVDGYFADYDAGKLEISAATAKNYRAMAKRVRARFNDVPVTAISRSGLRQWYMDLKGEASLSIANLAIGAMGAFLRWATWQDWILASPAVKLGRTSNTGRRVFWTREEELAFAPWCDAHGYGDVADAVIFGLWTGARPHDLCAATVEGLAGETWRYVPHKGKKRGREALAGILPPLRDRLTRRAGEAKASKVKAIGATPFLLNPFTARAHTTISLGQRFRTARAEALLADAVPESLQGKQLRDTRDACVTRLYLAGVPLDRIPAWTGHSPSDRDGILREHYLVLREEATIEDAAKLEVWAKKQGLVL